PRNTAAVPDRFGIVGGGLLGMTLALRLRERGHAVTIVESGSTLGGLAQPWSIGDLTWDRHYHVTLLSDRHLRELLAELDLDAEIRWTTTRTGFFTDGRFYDMSNLVDFIRFPPLGLFDKFRLGSTILYASRIADGRPLERIGVAEWLTRLSGRRTFEKIWRPLLRAKLGERYADASAAFIWAIIARLYAARRSGIGRELFGYVPGGYARVLATFAARLEQRGVAIELGTKVARVGRGPGGGCAITMADGRLLDFDRVIVTAAAPQAARLCPELPADEARRMRDKRYQGIVCASLVLDEPLGPYYITNLTDDWVPFSAVIDMSAIVDRKEFGGKALVYLPKYVAPDDPLFEATDETIRASFIAALTRMYPTFSERTILGFRVSRVREVFPIATIGYSDDLPPVASSIPGLFFVNSAHIVNGTLNVNETIQLAQRELATLAPLTVST
ncbi:MAG: NAD(P)/FAD-dependent oxidoreductase, partial [Vulcanimicrobiaceae bacterium]